MKQVTLDIYHEANEKIETGDVVSTTTSEFNYNGVTHCFDEDATEYTTVIAEFIESDYTDYDSAKCRNGGKYGYDFYKVVEVDPIVEFDCTFKDEEINGYVYVSEIDDERPLRFYDRTGIEQWQIPSNPYDELDERWCDYDYMVEVFSENNILQILADYVLESRTIVLEESLDGSVFLNIYRND